MKLRSHFPFTHKLRVVSWISTTSRQRWKPRSKRRVAQIHKRKEWYSVLFPFSRARKELLSILQSANFAAKVQIIMSMAIWLVQELHTIRDVLGQNVERCVLFRIPIILQVYISVYLMMNSYKQYSQRGTRPGKLGKP